MKVLNKFAFVRLNKNNEILFSEYCKAKNNYLTKDAAVRIIRGVLRENLSEDDTVKQILERLIMGDVYVSLLSKSRLPKSR